MNDTEAETPVIFTWADREGGSWWLLAFIFISFLLHSAAFFLFQGKDPVPPRTVRTAPTVQILTASGDPSRISPETKALLQWIAMHDPALVARVQTVEPAGLLDIRYQPSFREIRTQPLGAPPDPPVIQIPPAREPLAMIRSLSAPEKIAPPAVRPQATDVRFSEALRKRSKEGAAFAPSARTGAIAQPTIVLVGVNGEGEARYAFLQQASGDAALDADALAYVRALSFSKAGDGVQWGTVTIAWGDDVIATAPPK